MMLDRLEGNAELKSSVRLMLDSRRLTHSVLLVGEEGLGAGFAARCVAADYLYPQGGAPAEALVRGECCRAVAKAGKRDSGQIETGVVREAISVTGMGSGGKYLVGQVTAMRSEIFNTSLSAEGRAVLLYHVERMNEESANALLKVMEEPPEGVLFLLTADSLAGVLPTIRSRCISFAMAPVSPADCARYCTKQGVDAKAAALYSELFDGHIGTVLASARDDARREQVEQALTLAKAAAAKDSYAAAVLLAAVIEAVSGLSIDGFVGLAVSLFILYSGAKLAKETISPLLGEAASPELQSRIVDYISAQPKVLGYHDLMVHDYGPGQRFATIHVEMDCKEDPMQCHELIDDMERECLKSHNIHLVIHYDPVVTDDPELTRLHILVDDLLSEMDARLKTHDFRMVPGGGHTNLIFDIAVPQDIKLTKQDIQSRLEEALRTREGKIYHTVITFDPIAFNQESCEHLPNGQ